MNKVLLAYLAGIVDGEGYIGIKKNNSSKKSKSPVFSERLSIGMSERFILEMFKKQFGGKIYEKKCKSKKLNNNLTIYYWDITDKMASKVLTILAPFIRIKKKQLLLVLKLSKTKIERKNNKDKIVSPQVNKYRDSLYKKIKTIHGNHHN